MNKSKLLFSALITLLLGFSISLSAQPYLAAGIGVADPSGGELSSANVLRLTAGYRLTQALALEITNSEFTAIELDSDNEAELSGQELSLLVHSSFSGNNELFFRAGIHNWSADIKGSVEQFDDVNDDNDFVFGLGYARVLEEQGAVKLELSRYKVGGIDLNVVTGIFEARF